jgi:hypothetical protein
LTTFVGPDFEWIEETTLERLTERGGGALSRPLLVRGAVRAWPAWKSWSFEQLAERCRAGGKDLVWRFQEGLVEQGHTQPLPRLPVAPYLEELAQAAGRPLAPEAGLLPESRRKALGPGERFRLNWPYMQTFETNRRYLADWPILDEIPELRRDFAIRTLWPGLRWTWEYVFIGPAHTVTGLHQDIHHNWFCQVRGSKELLLFPPDQTPHMCISRKFNLGSVLSEINIGRLHEQPREAAEFEKTHGLYARVEAGDALFIPKHTWHAVVALEPSVSLGIFGLTAFEIATAGAWEEIKNLLHLLRLYRWRNCICHESAP